MPKFKIKIIKLSWDIESEVGESKSKTLSMRGRKKKRMGLFPGCCDDVIVGLGWWKNKKS